MVPETGGRSPRTVRKKVVFPEPLRPTTTTSVPGRRVRSQGGSKGRPPWPMTSWLQRSRGPSTSGPPLGLEALLDQRHQPLDVVQVRLPALEIGASRHPHQGGRDAI